MKYNTIIIPFIVAVINWLVVSRYVKNKNGSIRYFEYLTKPAVILILIGWLWSVSNFSDRSLLFALGLACSLIGDLFLMFPKTRYTMAGAVFSFMLTHIFYIIGLTTAFPPPINPASIIVVILVFVTSGCIYWRLIHSSLLRSSKGLSLAITVYIFLLSLMLISCLYTYVQGELWKDVEALLVGCGGLLFFISDTILAWNLYIKTIPNSKLINRIAYHIGQIALIFGIALHFTR